MKTLLKIVLALVLLGLAALAWLVQDGRQQLQQALAIPAAQVLEVPPGSSLNAVVSEMQTRGLFRSWRAPLHLRLRARLTGQNTRIKAGEFELRPGMSALDVLSLLVSGKTLLHELRIVEGSSFAQMMALVMQHPALEHQLTSSDAASVMSALGHPGLPAEGRFFPDTYRFPKGTTDIAFLRRAQAAMSQALEQEWAQRDLNAPYENADEALTMASIVEKETGLASERALIAGVFVNRLRIGMRLQTDPTVIYGLGAAFDGNLRRKDLQTDTPYNTYTRGGLPPTPICLPGRAAIHAALHPASTKALFFVARRDGSHAFSETLQQHNAAVREYQLRRSRQAPSDPKK